MDKQKILELEAMMVVLAQRIEKLKRETVGGGTSKPDSMWLEDLRKDAQKLLSRMN